MLKSIRELLEKVQTKVAKKQAGKYPIKVAINQVEKRLTKQQETWLEKWIKVASNYSRKIARKRTNLCETVSKKQEGTREESKQEKYQGTRK